MTFKLIIVKHEFIIYLKLFLNNKNLNSNHYQIRKLIYYIFNHNRNDNRYVINEFITENHNRYVINEFITESGKP